MQPWAPGALHVYWQKTPEDIRITDFGEDLEQGLASARMSNAELNTGRPEPPDVGRFGPSGFLFSAHILPLADAMEKHERYVGATVVYRALLESILARAPSKYYHHGVQYLRKLDQLSKKIDRWGDVQPHEASAGEKSIRHGHPHARWHRGVLTRKTVRPCTWVPLKYLRHSEKQIEVVVQRLACAALGNNHLIWFNYS
jgi:hypothetical protein